MNKIFAFLAFVITLAVFTSCDKDIEINDDYKDITIIYGLLDPTDSISYLRIEKAFLSNGDIYQAAQIPDSNIFSYKLDAKLLDKDGDVVVVLIQLPFIIRKKEFFMLQLCKFIMRLQNSFG